MFRIIRTEVLDGLHADSAELETLREELAAAKYAAGLANDAAIRADITTEQLLRDLARTHVALIESEREKAEQFQGLVAVIKQVTAERDEARRVLPEHGTAPDAFQ